MLANEEIGKKINSDLSLSVSPWMTEFINLFKNKTDGLEITIISPNLFNNKSENFFIDDIKVHLIKYKQEFTPHRAHNLSFKYRISRNNISKIVHNVNPDLIHLFGSENPVYSSSFLDLYKKYPIILSIQGFVSLSSKPKNILKQFVRWNRIRFENKINLLANDITVASKNVTEELNKKNVKAKLHSIFYPTTTPNFSAENIKDKKYDLVYYAKITHDKGVEDFIKTIHILKEKGHLLKAIIIGGGAVEYVEKVQKMVVDLGLSNDISFTGYLKSQQEVFKIASSAKVYVLPTHFDGIPGTIREAMIMKLPVIAYAVGGIPTFNFEKECITLVEKKNIVELAQKIIDTLTNTDKTRLIVSNAYELMKKHYNNDDIYNNLILAYKEVLK